MHIKKNLYVGLLALGLCTALSLEPSAHAQDANSSPLADLYACQALKQVIERSNCYDAATKGLQRAEEQGEVITLHANEFKEIQEGVFGYKHTPLSKYSVDVDLEITAQFNPLKTMTVPVKKVERYLSGYVITLDNNQVWEQFAGNIARIPKGKLSAEIKTTPTGTYKMILFNSKNRINNIKVRRIQ